jgi:hypothetical protein
MPTLAHSFRRPCAKQVFCLRSESKVHIRRKDQPLNQLAHTLNKQANYFSLLNKPAFPAFRLASNYPLRFNAFNKPGR